MTTVGPAALKQEIASLLRFLLCRSPFIAEKRWAFERAFPRLPADRWIEIRGQAGRGWIYLGSDGSGLHRQSPPDGVAASDITVIVDPPGPSFALRDRFDRLVRQLPPGLERARLERIGPALRGMGNGDFETREVEDFLDRCYGSYQRGMMERPADAPLMRSMAEYNTDLHERFLNLEAPGSLVGLMRLLDLSWHDCAFFSPIWFEWETGQPLPSDIVGLVRKVFSWICNDAGVGWQAIERAASAMQTKGSDLLTEALATADSADFYTRLHESCAWSHGAAEGFGYLMRNAALDQAGRETMRKQHKVSQEFGITASTSLLHAYGNVESGGKQFQYDKARVEKVHETKGEAAAENLVSQMLERELLYPGSDRATFRT